MQFIHVCVRSLSQFNAWSHSRTLPQEESRPCSRSSAKVTHIINSQLSHSAASSIQVFNPSWMVNLLVPVSYTSIIVNSSHQLFYINGCASANGLFCALRSNTHAATNVGVSGLKAHQTKTFVVLQKRIKKTHVSNPFGSSRSSPFCPGFHRAAQKPWGASFCLQ